METFPLRFERMGERPPPEYRQRHLLPKMLKSFTETRMRLPASGPLRFDAEAPKMISGP